MPIYVYCNYMVNKGCNSRILSRNKDNIMMPQLDEVVIQFRRGLVGLASSENRVMFIRRYHVMIEADITMQKSHISQIICFAV